MQSDGPGQEARERAMSIEIRFAIFILIAFVVAVIVHRVFRNPPPPSNVNSTAPHW
jgi:hypothetical protein